MGKLIFSQTDYPKKLIINGDTLCALTMPMVDSINVAYISLDECKAIKDTMQSQIEQYKEVVEAQNERFGMTVRKDELRQRVLQEQNNQLDAYQEKDENNKKKIKWLKFQRNALAISTVALAVTIFIFK